MMMKTFAFILVMIMLIMSLPCTALAETSEAAGEPEDIGEHVLSGEKAGAANIIGSAGEHIISSLGKHFNLGIFGDIGSALFGELMGGIFGDDTDETLIDMLTQVQKQLDALSHKIDEQTQQIKQAITDSELSSDLRKVNELYAQTDRLYSDYSAILAITDGEVRARELDSFFRSTVPKANIRSMITSCGAYLTKSSGGSPSLCSMYYESCCGTYTFEHQMADGVNAFYIYHLGNIQKMLMLYNDWCEYTAGDKSDPNDARMLELKRAVAEADKIYSAIAEQLYISFLTTDIAHTGTDALGNGVSYYIVRLNSDHRRYVVVDKAYGYGTFYGKAKETYYTAGGNDIKTHLQSQKTSGYDKLMTTPPTSGAVLTGMVIANPTDADGFFAKAARNEILSYLKNNGMKLNSADASKATAFVMSDAVAHSEKPSASLLARYYGEVKGSKIISNESCYLHYFMSNADEKKLKKNIDYTQSLGYTLRADGPYAAKIGKYEEVKLSGGNSQLVVYADYIIKSYSKYYYDFPMYLIYKLNEDLDYTGTELHTQAGGIFEMYIWGINVWWFIGIGAALAISAGVAVVIVLCKRKKRS